MEAEGPSHPAGASSLESSTGDQDPRWEGVGGRPPGVEDSGQPRLQSQATQGMLVVLPMTLQVTLK